MPEDSRKTYVLTTIANYFGVDYDSLSSLSDNRALNAFLDDANCPLLSATRGPRQGVELSIEVRTFLSHENPCFIIASLQIKVSEGVQSLVLFKQRPEVITADNVHSSIFLSSMVDSPLDSLYYMIKSVFAPALRENTNKSNLAANQQVQTSLNELEQMLRASGKKAAGGSSSSMAGIAHPKDEITHWYDVARNASTKTSDLERAKYFLQLFEPVKANFDNLEK